LARKEDGRILGVILLSRPTLVQLCFVAPISEPLLRVLGRVRRETVRVKRFRAWSRATGYSDANPILAAPVTDVVGLRAPATKRDLNSFPVVRFGRGNSLRTGL